MQQCGDIKKKAMVIAVIGALAVMAETAHADLTNIEEGSNLAYTTVGVSITTDLDAYYNLSTIIAANTPGFTNSASIASFLNGASATDGVAALILGNPSGVYNKGTIGQLANAYGATIASTNSGYAVLNEGSIGSILNSGVIGKYTTTIDGTAFSFLSRHGIVNNYYGRIDAIINGGDIYAGTVANSYGIYNLTTSTIGTIQNIGGISAYAGIGNFGSITSLINSGVIVAISAAIVNNSSIGTLSNAAGGEISSSDGVAIQNSGHIGLLTNSGLMYAPGFVIYNNGSTMDEIDNAGIVAGLYGIFNNTGATIGSINNSGTIAANYAIQNAGSLGTITNTGLIAGNITNTSANPLTIVGASATGSVFGTLTGCGGASVLSGGTSLRCAGASTIGTLSNTASNVYLSGNSLLNDNVLLDSAGTLSMSGGTLKLTNAISIAGNYAQAADANLLIAVGDKANGVVDTGASLTTLLADTGYGRLVVSGAATIASGSTVTLQKTGSYAFAAGQRFVVVDASATGTQYNDASLKYPITGASGLTGSGATVISTDKTRADLVVTVVVAAPVATTAPGDTSAGSDTGTGVGAGGGDTTTSTTASSATSSSASTSTSAPLKSPATGSNALGALKGLASYSGITDPGLNELYNAGQALNLVSSTEANKAGDKLSPATQSGSAQAALSSTYNVMGVVGAHLDGQRLGNAVAQTGVSSGEAGASKAIWGQAFGGHASQNQRGDVAGYSANYSGLMLGADKAINDQWRAGGVFSYSNTAVNSSGNLSGNTTRVNGYGLFGYASYVAAKWYANLSAGALYQNYKQNRQVEFSGFSGTAGSSFGGSQFVARGEVGYPLALGAATLTPIASVTYAYSHQNGYTESGGNGAGLSVDASHATSVQSDLGVRIERAYTSHYGVLIPSMQVAWHHEYDHQKASVAARFAADPIGETRFTTMGATPLSDTGILTAGLTLLRANNLSVTAQYTLQAGSGYLSQAGAVKLRQLF